MRSWCNGLVSECDRYTTRHTYRRHKRIHCNYKCAKHYNVLYICTYTVFVKKILFGIKSLAIKWKKGKSIEKKSKERKRERVSENSIVIFVSMLLTLTFVCMWVRMCVHSMDRVKRENKHLMRAVFTFYYSCYYCYDWTAKYAI